MVMYILVIVSMHVYYQNFEPQNTGVNECHLGYSVVEESPGKVDIQTVLSCLRKTKQKTKIWKLAVLHSWGLGMETSH